ncbi:glycoside hydrolase family 5 protein [Sorangium sp. So ce1128]
MASGGAETSAGGATGNAGSQASAGSGGLGGVPGGAATSAELLEKMHLGWNVGNSLDVPEGETAWGNPEISQTLLQAVAGAGFNIVRIPVTWSMHTGPGPDFVIEPAFLDRVDQVIQLAVSNGLYAIINVHHDGADNYEGVEWLTLNDSSGAITAANNAAVEARFVKIWQQIATRFAGYGEELLFESMNEIHDGYDEPKTEYYGIINNLNQKFVNVVRESGGKNTTRHLVVPGYNTNVDYTLAGFVAPQDPTPSHLILSVHYYDPWSFCGEATTNTWGAASPGSDNWGQESHVVSQLDKLDAKFQKAGLPVIMGEYGAVLQEGFENYRRYYMEYVTKAAADRGIVPIYWDNGAQASGKEGFGLFDRATGAVTQPALVEAMLRAATSSYTLNDVAKP